MSIAADTSKRNKKNIIAFIVVGLVFFGLFVANIARYFYLGAFDPVATFFYLMIMVIVYGRTKPTYDVSVERKYFKIVKHGLFGKNKVFEIPYREIAGIFVYKPELVRSVKFRHTYRMNSALDNRTVWTLAWRRPKKNSSEDENVRIYFKASKEVIAALSDKLPNKVAVPENLVNLEILKREGSISHNDEVIKRAEAEMLGISVEEMDAQAAKAEIKEAADTKEEAKQAKE